VTAEMVKHATNAFLATSISFANELARIGELMGVDNQAVATALKMDKRIGKGAYVTPGLGFAGGTLPRDLRILQKFAREHDIPSQLVDSVLNINEATSDSLVSSTRNYLGELRGKTILIVGYTYKPEIDTLRRSSSLELGEKLKAQGATVWGYDPVMNSRDLTPLEGLIRHFNEWNEIPSTPDAAIIMTPRPQFAALDWKNLGARGESGGAMKAPLVFDTRSSLPSAAILSAGFTYKALWQPVQSRG
jgi:UDPglucose 6-dehydrogenase